MNFLMDLSTLEDGTLVLASTERVARHLKLQASLIQSVSGKKAWFAKGKIQTITSWIESAWLDLMPNEQLLFPVQELATVKSVIDESGLLPPNMISTTSAARRIGQAYSTVYKYQIPMDQERFRFKEEYEAFFAWKALIDDVCKSRQHVFRAHMPGLLLAAVLAGEVILPKRVVIVGMINLNPAESSLFDALKERGVDVSIVPAEGQQATPNLLRAHNTAAEFTEVAQWVTEQLKPFVETPLAAPSIAILVPEVRNYQAPLLDALSLHTSPGSLLPAGPDGEVKAPWDISSGATLGSRPVIRAAMDILAISPYKADPEGFSRVLRSRWIGGDSTESSSRSLLDIWFRDNMGLNMGGNDFLRAIGVYKGNAVPDFRKRFAGYLEALINGVQNRYPSEWADHFTQALEGMGWPGQRDLDSATFQTLKAWDEALALFRTLDAQLGTVPYARSIMWLREIIDTRQFQPRISHVAPVSILGYEDAIGLSFDCVWIIGAANTVLPERVDPSPFIPTELQSDAGIVEASGEASLEHAQKVVAALLSVSESVTVSCACHTDKGASVGPSELFGAWPSMAEKISSKGDFIDQLMGQLDRTTFELETVPAVTSLELTNLKGGVRIFTDYAESPFFAFARNRLRADMFPVPIIGLDPRIQGTMIHLVLELFWKEVKTSTALKALSDSELSELVDTKVSEAAEQGLNKLIWRYGAKLINLEKMRLSSLTHMWLEFEKQREHEFEVRGFEEAYSINIAGIPLNVKIDREDRVFLSKPDDESEEGAEGANVIEYRDVLHDYKGGNSMRMSSLNAETLTQPQLPIYATKVDFVSKNGRNPDGVALAQVNQKSLGYHVRSNFTASLVVSDSRRPRKEDVDNESKWASQCLAWDTVLDDMSRGFQAGHADLSLKGKEYPMGYEYLAPLSR